MQAVEARAKKLVKQEEAQCMKAQQLAEQATTKVAKVMEKARRKSVPTGIAGNRKSKWATNYCSTKRGAKWRNHFSSIVKAAILSTSRHSSSTSSHFPICARPNRHAWPICVLATTLIPSESSPAFSVGHPLLSTLHSTPSNGLLSSSEAFTFSYYVLPMSMQPNRPWPFHNQEEE